MQGRKKAVTEAVETYFLAIQNVWKERLQKAENCYEIEAKTCKLV